MKILHIIPSVGPRRGGPSFAIRTITTELANQGLSVDVVTTDDNGQERLPVQLGRPVPENGVNFWYFSRDVRFYTFSLSLSRWLAAHVGEYDLVHIHALFSFAATAGAFWAQRRDVPYIVRPLGVLNTWGMKNRRPFLKRLSVRLIEQKILANAAAVHFTSEQERCEAESALPGMRSIVIPNPVATPAVEDKTRTNLFLSSRPELAGKQIVLFLSRLDPKKGLDLLLDGFAQARTACPDAVLVIAGDGEDNFVTQLRSQAHRLGIEKYVCWAGFLDGEIKSDSYAAASVFALPSYSENFGIAVVEALACGLPVIVSDQVGIHQNITRREAGIVVACRAAEVSVAIEQLLNNTAARKHMGSNAIALAQTFSPSSVAAQLLDTYQRITRDHRLVRTVDLVAH